MFLGRAGVIGYYAKKSRENAQKKKEHFLLTHKKEFQEKNKNLKVLEYNDHPWAAWILGFLMILSGASLIYLISLGKYNSIFSEFHEGFWWQYLISMFIFLLGFTFLLAVESEKVEIHKELKLIIVKKSTIFCKKKFYTRDLSNLVDICIVKRGHDSKTNNTIHYLIQMNFDGERKLEILEKNSRVEIKKKYAEINTFLSRDFLPEKVDIINESTSASTKTNKTTVSQNSTMEDQVLITKRNQI